MTRSRRAKGSESTILSLEQIGQRIQMIRGQRVILASDLARMDGVPVKRLNEQVKRNSDRFPDDFMIQLTRAETEALSRSQFATLNAGGAVLKSQSATSRRGTNVKYRPYAFTEHGTIMAANLLRSEQAVKVSVFVVRAFVKLREMLSTHRELAQKLSELESRLQDHDGQIVAIIDAIRELMKNPAGRRKPPIGYHTELTRKK